jgi:thiamine kinase-like enzyme
MANTLFTGAFEQLKDALTSLERANQMSADYSGVLTELKSTLQWSENVRYQIWGKVIEQNFWGIKDWRIEWGSIVSETLWGIQPVVDFLQNQIRTNLDEPRVLERFTQLLVYIQSLQEQVLRIAQSIETTLKSLEEHPVLLSKHHQEMLDLYLDCILQIKEISGFVKRHIAFIQWMDQKPLSNEQLLGYSDLAPDELTPVDVEWIKLEKIVHFALDLANHTDSLISDYDSAEASRIKLWFMETSKVSESMSKTDVLKTINELSEALLGIIELSNTTTLPPALWKLVQSIQIQIDILSPRGTLSQIAPQFWELVHLLERKAA